MLAASNFEFKNRFWIIGAIFCTAFWSYSIDHQNAGVALTEWMARLRGSTATNTDYRWTFAIASLVADGPYRYVRNPLYFGNILLAIGFGMMASRVGCAILIVGMLVFVCRLILRSEEH